MKKSILSLFMIFSLLKGYSQITLPVYQGTFFKIGSKANTITSAATGKVWMDRNLGATRVATSSTDDLAYGDLYQWGRQADGHQLMTWIGSTRGYSTNSTVNGTSSTSTVSTNSTKMLIGYSNWYTGTSPAQNNLWQGVNGINNPCPSGYRLPTSVEFDAERTAFSSGDAAGAFASALKLPVAGYRYDSDGSINFVGSNGYYWCSTVGDGTFATNLSFNGGQASMSTNSRTTAYSVRCIKN